MLNQEQILTDLLQDYKYLFGSYCNLNNSRSYATPPETTARRQPLNIEFEFRRCPASAASSSYYQSWPSIKFLGMTESTVILLCPAHLSSHNLMTRGFYRPHLEKRTVISSKAVL